ncbi:MAG: sulfur carrier protein ThiS [Bacillota bacterium]
MEIVVNGKTEELNEEVELIGFLENKDLELEKLVIEYNQQLVKEEEWDDIKLTAGDQLEILKFVGGG